MVVVVGCLGRIYVVHLTMNQMHFGNHSTSDRDGSSAKKSPWNLPAGYRNISATGLHVNLETVMA